MRKFIGCLILITAFSTKSSGASDIIGDSILFQLHGGKTDVHGYFKDQLGSGYNFGILIGYTFFKNRLLLLESGLSYTEISLKESSLSKLTYYSFELGPVFYVPLWSSLRPFAGFSASLNYFELSAVATRNKEKTIKAGISARAGFNIPVYNTISANLGIKYSVNELSGKVFQNISYFGSASYLYNFVTKEKAEKNIQQIELDEQYESGLKYFKIGDGLRAREYFNKVSLVDSHYKEVENYLKIITISEENYNTALKLIAEDKHFEALPLLIEAEKYLIGSFEKLREIRLLLSKEESNLVKNAIDAYNREDYENCIIYMKRVQLINPGNESVNLYLPRAIKRYDALKKIE